MGLRCSLLGHEYGDVTVERDREERGNEVVTVERELEVCDRCGAERVVSENTEVRSLESEPATNEPADPSAESPQPPGTGAADADRPADSAASTVSESPDDLGGTSGAGPTANYGSGAEAGNEQDAGSTAPEAAIEDAEGKDFEPPASAAEDDAIILDDEDTQSERDHGQWAETDDHRQEATAAESTAEDAGAGDSVATSEHADSADPSGDAEVLAEDAAAESPRSGLPEQASTERASAEGSARDAGDPGNAGDGSTDTEETPATASDPRDVVADEATTAWPEHEGEDEGFDAKPGEADAEFEGEGLGADDIRAATESASGGGDDEPGATAEAEFVEAGSGITSAGPFEETGSDTIETTLICPECGIERDAAGSSLRAGDICPECRRGYLAEQ